ncbi:MAG: aromatic ring-hydroxylating oxygenase subunit alpha, partial [bacterium]
RLSSEKIMRVFHPIENRPESMKDPAQSFDIHDFFDEELERRLNLPTADGSALPNIAYTSEAFYRFEQQTVFRKSWVFAAFAHQLPDPGDMLPVDIAGQPVVIVRDEDNIIRAFHNVCRHRGAKLIDQFQKNRKSFVCPNHSWSYGLDGRLNVRPHFFGGEKHDINRDPRHRSDLAKVRCAVWHDWIFININGQASEFNEHIRFIEEQLENYDFSVLGFAEKLEFDIDANWKLAIENFIEPYHVFSCHPWLNSFVSMDQRTPPDYHQQILYCGYQFDKTDPARGEGLPYFPDLTEEQQKRGDWYVLFPNFAFEIFPDQVDVFIATPESAGRSRETIALYFIGEGASGEHYETARRHVIQNWHDLNQEDIGIIERMQAGRASEGFDGGVLSPYWDPVQQHFARLIVTAMC